MPSIASEKAARAGDIAERSIGTMGVPLPHRWILTQEDLRQLVLADAAALDARVDDDLEAAGSVRLGGRKGRQQRPGS